MADNDSTSTNSADTMSLQNRIEEDLSAAAAIVDCVRVLSALERSPEVPQAALQGGMCMGGGWADGVTTADDSMPMALWHAGRLIASAQELSGHMYQLAREAKLKPVA